MKLFLRNVSSTLIVTFFSQKNEKFKLGKFRKDMKRFFKRKRLQPFKRHLQQNCRSESINMPVGAGRLIKQWHDEQNCTLHLFCFAKLYNATNIAVFPNSVILTEIRFFGGKL